MNHMKNIYVNELLFQHGKKYLKLLAFKIFNIFRINVSNIDTNDNFDTIYKHYIYVLIMF